jgi:hypothetical protein
MTRVADPTLKAKNVGRKLLSDLVTIVTPKTLIAWHRKLSLISMMAVQNEHLNDLLP